MSLLDVVATRDGGREGHPNIEEHGRLLVAITRKGDPNVGRVSTGAGGRGRYLTWRNGSIHWFLWRSESACWLPSSGETMWGKK